MWWDLPPSDPAKLQDPGSYRLGLWRLAIIFGTIVIAAALTYVIPGLEDWRPWVPGEKIPLASMVSLKPSVGQSSTADSAPIDTLEKAQELAAQTLGEGLAANLGQEAIGVEEADTGDEKVVVNLEIDESELEGLVLELEDPSGVAMDSFYKALAETASEDSTRITRIAHWGDSTIAADDVTSTLRRRFQKRFGDSGHGFQLIGKGTMPYRHKDVVSVQTGSWNEHSVIRKGIANGRYGFGGVVHKSRGGGQAKYQTVSKGPIGKNVGSFELFYQRHPGGGKFQMIVDGGTPVVIDSKSEVLEDAWELITLEDGPHTLELRTLSGGESIMYGIAMERPQAGVVYDSLGIVGARASRMLNFDEEHLAGQIAHRSPDLLVIAFGGNEASDKGMNFERYRNVLTQVITRVRAGNPNASCMVMAPLDQGEKDSRGRIRTMPNVPQIVAAQREIAAAQGCAFFDTFQAMGGEGAMGRWYNAKPRLGWGDYRHATPAGYEVVGNMVYKAMLKGFSDYLKRSN